MDEQTPDTSAEQPLQSLDLSALAGLSLGPKWGSGDAPPKRYADYEEGGDRGPRNRSGGGGQRRDRRPHFDRPAGGGGDRPQGDRPQGDRPAFSGPRPAGAGPQGDRGAPRGDRPPPRGDGGNRGNFGGERRGGPQRRDRYEDRAPFQPIVEVSFYPEDAPFKVLTQALKSSSRTFELFEIARLILQKPERFVVVIKPLPRQDGTTSPVFISGPDNLPFESEAEAMDHVFSNQLDSFFTIETVDVEAPKGSYTVINRCTLTGELLGPPNYHRYQALCQQHHAAKLSNMSFDRFASKIESVRDPEIVQQWLQKMTKQIRYTVKNPAPGTEAQQFDNRDSARFFLITHCKEQLVRSAPTARFEGKMIERIPANSAIRHSIEFSLEQQRHFPLDTANHLRGRLRRMNYSVYKKGSKGISYVCAVKRRFRLPTQIFADSVQQLIDFIEHHPNILASDLPKEYLGIVQDIAPAAAQPAPEAESAPAAEGAEPAPAADEAAKAAPAASTLTVEDQNHLRQLRIDLRWLVTEGYVIEYSNGRLFSPPPQANPPKDDDESDSHTAESSEEAAPAAESTEVVQPIISVPVEPANVEQPSPEAAPAEEPKAE